VGSVFGPIRFLLPVCRLCWFLYTLNIHFVYAHFNRIFLSHYWWQKSDIWSQALYRYPISWEAFFDPSDSYFLFAEEWGYHKWALAHSSSCFFNLYDFNIFFSMLNRCMWCHFHHQNIEKLCYPRRYSRLIRTEWRHSLGLPRGDNHV
jgi:hypothetical protein